MSEGQCECKSELTECVKKTRSDRGTEKEQKWQSRRGPKKALRAHRNNGTEGREKKQKTGTEGLGQVGGRGE